MQCRIRNDFNKHFSLCYIKNWLVYLILILWMDFLFVHDFLVTLYIDNLAHNGRSSFPNFSYFLELTTNSCQISLKVIVYFVKFWEKCLPNIEVWITIVCLWVVLSSKNADPRKKRLIQLWAPPRLFHGTVILLWYATQEMCVSHYPFCHKEYYKRSRFNKIIVTASSKTFFSETGFSFITMSAWQRKLQWLWVQFSASSLTCMEAPASTPTTASAPSVQMSTQAKRQITFYHYEENSFNCTDFLKGS